MPSKNIQIIFNAVTITTYFTLILSACSESTSVSNKTTQTSTTSEPKIECDGTKPANELIMDVIGDGHLLYTLPNNQAPAVVNSVASQTFGATKYHTIDTSTRVKIQCEKGEWVFVQLTEPEWLTDVKGWTKRVNLKPLNASAGEPTKAIDSAINMNNLSTKGYTSEGLTKADLAWHAINTYGFDCTEVISKGEMTEKGYFLIKCSSGIELRVNPRTNKHPSISENQAEDNANFNKVENTSSNQINGKTTPVLDTKDYSENQEAVVIAVNANLRKSANQGSEIIKTIPEGTNIKIIKQKGP